jgi:altronate hydrolase
VNLFYNPKRHTFMQDKVLQLDPRDNVLIALADLKRGESVEFSGKTHTLVTDVRAKHKFTTEDLVIGSNVTMYGVLVGKAFEPVQKGEVLTLGNIRHEASEYHEKSEVFRWNPPDVSSWKQRKFL